MYRDMAGELLCTSTHRARFESNFFMHVIRKNMPIASTIATGLMQEGKVLGYTCFGMKYAAWSSKG